MRQAVVVAFFAVAIAVAGAIAFAAPADARDAARTRNPYLTDAQAALEELRYEDAARLLDRAWKLGGASPAELALVFRLQGEVAATLGDAAAAETAFRRLLAIVPAAALPEGTSPKITASFDAARRWFTGREPVRLEHQVTRGTVVVLLVASDPLQLVTGAQADYRSQDGIKGTVAGRGAARIELPLPTGRLEVVLAATDEYGNRLVEIGADAPLVLGAGGEVGTDDRTPPRLDDRRADRPRHHRPLYARWWLYGGLAVGFGAGGGWFAYAARGAQDDLDALNADSANHDFHDALAAEDRLHRDVLLANIGFGAAGVCAVVATILLIYGDDDGDAASGRGDRADRDGRRGTVTPLVTPDGGAGLTVSVGF